MALKLSVCVALLALVNASPVPYSTETNYGSSLSATTEAGWSGKQASPLSARGSLTASEESQTKAFVSNLLSKIGVGQAENKNEVTNAIMTKVAEGKSDASSAGHKEKRDGDAVQAQAEQGKKAQEGRSWWDGVKAFFRGGEEQMEKRDVGAEQEGEHGRHGQHPQAGQHQHHDAQQQQQDVQQQQQQAAAQLQQRELMDASVQDFGMDQQDRERMTEVNQRAVEAQGLADCDEATHQMEGGQTMQGMVQ